jgi:hypothetical protein
MKSKLGTGFQHELKILRDQSIATLNSRIQHKNFCLELTKKSFEGLTHSSKCEKTEEA